jgi:tight adherence protein C
MNDATLYAVLSFLGVVVAGLLVARIASRMAAAQSPTPAAAPADPRIFGGLTEALAEQLPVRDTDRVEMQKELKQAGYLRPSALQELSALRFVLVVLPLVLAGVVAVASPALALAATFGGGVLALLGYALPRVMLVPMANRRRESVVRGLPDALDLINMCLAQGLSLPNAMMRVQGELSNTHPELAQELGIVAQQSRLGSLEQSLRQMETRVDAPEVKSLADILVQSERLGTRMTTTLSTFTTSVRSSLQQKAASQANSAAFKLLFPTVLCLMPAVYLILFGPAVRELTRFVQEGGFSQLTRVRQSAQDVAAQRFE